MSTRGNFRLPHDAIVKIVYDALQAASNTWVVEAEIHDDAPDQAAPPIVEIGDVEVSSGGTKDRSLLKGSIQLICWASTTGRRQCHDLMNQVVRAATAIPAGAQMEDGYELVDAKLADASSENLVDEQGRHWQRGRVSVDLIVLDKGSS